MLDDLQKRLDKEVDNLRAAREAKDEMSQRMNVLLAEKQNQMKLKVKAEKHAEELKRELDLARAASQNIREGSDSLH